MSILLPFENSRIFDLLQNRVPIYDAKICPAVEREIQRGRNYAETMIAVRKISEGEHFAGYEIDLHGNADARIALHISRLLATKG